ncbi:hypothetical protein PPERSA_01985 [Pseudocohnilembus persalinus]|uniref:Uncharacterized protein n=1 Tax=Pseudocohnilembus persalinus TaxID=266149 RepID=A0A0V0QF46_PSEPJ|nr:hypothetical protein PPERSA_01985 [Pseudocohnilembus persalinus]|eukprot:KRX00806.1 hypothetical protein PPERSA_01985 [Pseudocohnilembus persalinus]
MFILCRDEYYGMTRQPIKCQNVENLLQHLIKKFEGCQIQYQNFYAIKSLWGNFTEDISFPVKIDQKGNIVYLQDQSLNRQNGNQKEDKQDKQILKESEEKKIEINHQKQNKQQDEETGNKYMKQEQEQQESQELAKCSEQSLIYIILIQSINDRVNSLSEFNNEDGVNNVLDVKQPNLNKEIARSLRSQKYFNQGQDKKQNDDEKNFKNKVFQNNYYDNESQNLSDLNQFEKNSFQNQGDSKGQNLSSLQQTQRQIDLAYNQVSKKHDQFILENKAQKNFLKSQILYKNFTISQEAENKYQEMKQNDFLRELQVNKGQQSYNIGNINQNMENQNLEKQYQQILNQTQIQDIKFQNQINTFQEFDQSQDFQQRRKKISINQLQQKQILKPFCLFGQDEKIQRFGFLFDLKKDKDLIKMENFLNINDFIQDQIESKEKNVYFNEKEVPLNYIIDFLGELEKYFESEVELFYSYDENSQQMFFMFQILENEWEYMNQVVMGDLIYRKQIKKIIILALLDEQIKKGFTKLQYSNLYEFKTHGDFVDSLDFAFQVTYEREKLTQFNKKQQRQILRGKKYYEQIKYSYQKYWNFESVGEMLNGENQMFLLEHNNKDQIQQINYAYKKIKKQKQVDDMQSKMNLKIHEKNKLKRKTFLEGQKVKNLEYQNLEKEKINKFQVNQKKFLEQNNHTKEYKQQQQNESLKQEQFQQKQLQKKTIALTNEQNQQDQQQVQNLQQQLKQDCGQQQDSFIQIQNLNLQQQKQKYEKKYEQIKNSQFLEKQKIKNIISWEQNQQINNKGCTVQTNMSEQSELLINLQNDEISNKLKNQKRKQTLQQQLHIEQNSNSKDDGQRESLILDDIYKIQKLNEYQNLKNACTDQNLKNIELLDNQYQQEEEKLVDQVQFNNETKDLQIYQQQNQEYDLKKKQKFNQDKLNQINEEQNMGNDELYLKLNQKNYNQKQNQECSNKQVETPKQIQLENQKQQEDQQIISLQQEQIGLQNELQNEEIQQQFQEYENQYSGYNNDYSTLQSNQKQ